MFGFWLFCIGFVDIEIIQTNAAKFILHFLLEKNRTSQLNLLYGEPFLLKNMNFRIILISS